MMMVTMMEVFLATTRERTGGQERSPLALPPFGPVSPNAPPPNTSYDPPLIRLPSVAPLLGLMSTNRRTVDLAWPRLFACVVLLVNGN
jgi:hypothetical protein